MALYSITTPEEWLASVPYSGIDSDTFQLDADIDFSKAKLGDGSPAWFPDETREPSTMHAGLRTNDPRIGKGVLKWQPRTSDGQFLRIHQYTIDNPDNSVSPDGILHTQVCVRNRDYGYDYNNDTSVYGPWKYYKYAKTEIYDAGNNGLPGVTTTHSNPDPETPWIEPTVTTFDPEYWTAITQDEYEAYYTLDVRFYDYAEYIEESQYYFTIDANGDRYYYKAMWTSWETPIPLLTDTDFFMPVPLEEVPILNSASSTPSKTVPYNQAQIDVYESMPEFDHWAGTNVIGTWDNPNGHIIEYNNHKIKNFYCDRRSTVINTYSSRVALLSRRTDGIYDCGNSDWYLEEPFIAGSQAPAICINHFSNGPANGNTGVIPNNFHIIKPVLVSTGGPISAVFSNNPQYVCVSGSIIIDDAFLFANSPYSSEGIRVGLVIANAIKTNADYAGDPYLWSNIKASGTIAIKGDPHVVGGVFSRIGRTSNAFKVKCLEADVRIELTGETIDVPKECSVGILSGYCEYLTSPPATPNAIEKASIRGTILRDGFTEEISAIVGHIQNGTVFTLSEVVSDVTIEDTENQTTNPTVYPITRDAVGDGTIICNAVYYRDDLSGDVPLGCVALSEQERKQQNSYPGLDFAEDWVMGVDYPELRAFAGWINPLYENGLNDLSRVNDLYNHNDLYAYNRLYDE